MRGFLPLFLATWETRKSHKKLERVIFSAQRALENIQWAPVRYLFHKGDFISIINIKKCFCRSIPHNSSSVSKEGKGINPLPSAQHTIQLVKTSVEFDTKTIKPQSVFRRKRGPVIPRMPFSSGANGQYRTKNGRRPVGCAHTSCMTTGCIDSRDSCWEFVSGKTLDNQHNRNTQYLI